MNILFPGLPNYTGPVTGWFSLLHHSWELVERSDDDVMERIRYIKSNKPAHEQEIRLRHIVYLGQRGDDYEVKRAALDTAYEAEYGKLYSAYSVKHDTLYAIYGIKRDKIPHTNKLVAYEAEQDKRKRNPLYAAHIDKLYAAYEAECNKLRANFEAKDDKLDASIIEYIKPLIKDFAWNGKELVFT